MSGWGITALLKTDGTAIHIRKSLWTRNLSMNYWPNSKLVMVRKEAVKDFLTRIYPTGVLVYDIKAFNSNSNLVTVSKLYGKEEASVVLVNYKGAMSLLTIGSKTLKEFRLCGHDSYRKSQVPLLINSDLEPINLYL